MNLNNDKLNIINKLGNEYGSPFYLFDIDNLREWTNKVKEELEGVRLIYAIKANPFFMRYLTDIVDAFEVCSPGEFNICKKENIDTKQIVFSGVNKRECDLEAVFSSTFEGVITIESKKHLDIVLSLISENDALKNKCIKLLPRLTNGSQFGMSEEDVLDVISSIKENIENGVQLRLDGIQFFSGTQKKKLSHIEKELIYIDEFCEKIKEKTGVLIKHIEYGAGLFYDYFEECDHILPAIEFAQLIKNYTSKYDFSIELGRYIAASSGTFISTIDDIKSNNDKNYIIVDGGINHLNYYGSMLGSNIPDVTHLRKCKDYVEIVTLDEETTASSVDKYNVCGSLCTFNDVLLRNFEMKEPQIGDLIVFSDTGAYSCTEAMALFLSRDMPRIFSYSNGNAEMLRDVVHSFELNS